MRTLITKSNLLLFAAAITLLAADLASAGVRARVEVTKDLGPATLRVRLQTPDRVQVHHAPVRVRPHRPAQLWVSRVDQRIAHRLSIVTGLPERPLLKKRARGIAWNRIARVHGISHRELKIAKSPKRFQRWLDRQHHHNHRSYGAGHFGDGCDHDQRRGGRKGRGGRGR